MYEESVVYVVCVSECIKRVTVYVCLEVEEKDEVV